MAMDKQNELTLFQTLWGFLETGNDDLFFLLDLVTDQIRLSGRSRELYPLPQDAGGICTLKDFSRIVHPRDLPKVARALGRGVRNLKRWIDEFKEETGLDEAIDEFNKTSRDLERTFKEADPRQDLKKARDDVKSALDDASKAAEQTLKDQPQQEE